MEVSGKIYVPTVLPLGKNPGTPWIAGLVGSNSVLDGYGEEKILLSRRECNPNGRVRSWPLTYLLHGAESFLRS